jgi:hypothetical protein
MDRDPHGIVPRRRLGSRGTLFDRLGAHDDHNDDAAPDGNRSRETCLPIRGEQVRPMHAGAGAATSAAVRAAEP